jgi:putative intracellular protease/amidase
MNMVALLVMVLAIVGIVAYFGLPKLVSALGLHPDYEGPRFRAPGKRALIVTTSQATLGPDGKDTGVFGSELTAPYYEFEDAGMDVDVASIRGGPIPIDPQSFIWVIADDADRRYLKDPKLQKKVQESIAIADVDPEAYDIIFLSGGWGAAYDLGTSENVGDFITKAWADGKVVGGVCHGPLGLLLAKDEAGQPLVAGRNLTAVTDKQVRELGITQTPQHPERELRAAGANFVSKTKFRDMFANHVVVDGRLVTGQNQNAGSEVAQQMMRVAGGTPTLDS